MSEEKKVVKVKLVKHEWPDERQARHRKYIKRALGVVLAVVLFLGGMTAGAFIVQPQESKGLTSSKLNMILKIMNELWYFGDEIDDLSTELLDDAIYGITTQEIDIHTQYLDSEYAQQFLSSMEGAFVGIGVQYSTATQDYIILRVFKDSPAENAGMRVGDIIRKVDGVAVEEIEDISGAVKGEAGSQVTITVQRGNEMLDLECIRGDVNSSANGYVSGDVGVLEILTVADNTASVVGEILADFEEQGIKKILIDLRDNGGGYLTSVVDIASYFLPKGSIVLQEQDKDKNIIEDRTNSDIEPYEYDQIEVLINQDTASAAEVLALALKETLNATIIGDVSYGKGTIQTTIPFSDGSMLKYTKAIWLSPNGNSINNVGITPDILVETEEALLTAAPQDFDPVSVDSVSTACQVMQIYLDYLGYDIDRQDGYFSTQTLQAMRQFEADYGLEAQDELDDELLTVILSKVIYVSRVDESKDIQKIRALEEFK